MDSEEETPPSKGASLANVAPGSSEDVKRRLEIMRMKVASSKQLMLAKIQARKLEMQLQSMRSASCIEKRAGAGTSASLGSPSSQPIAPPPTAPPPTLSSKGRLVITKRKMFSVPPAGKGSDGVQRLPNISGSNRVLKTARTKQRARICPDFLKDGICLNADCTLGHVYKPPAKKQKQGTGGEILIKSSTSIRRRAAAAAAAAIASAAREAQDSAMLLVTSRHKVRAPSRARTSPATEEATMGLDGLIPPGL